VRSTLKAVLLVTLLFATGCASYGSLEANHTTQVELSEGNFKVIATNVHGTSHGLGLFLSFFGIPFSRALDSVAMDDLMDGVDAEGKSIAIINVARERKIQNWLLFHVKTVEYRADVVEFTNPPAAAQ